MNSFNPIAPLRGVRENRLKRDVFLQLLELMERVRVTSEQLLRYARTKGLSAQGPTTPKDSLILLESAVELSGDAHLALKLGQRVGIESYGTLGFALMTCANLRESIDLTLRYGKVFFEPRWRAQDNDGDLVLWLDLKVNSPERQRIATELFFSQFSTIGSTLHRAKLDGAQVQFAIPAPANVGIYESTFDADLVFDAERSQIVLPRKVLDTPVRTANISEHLVFNRQCEEMLSGLQAAQKTTADVRCLLMQSAGQFSDVGKIAYQLNMSERTLRRRLTGENTSFRLILDEIRNLLAKEYLTRTELIVAEIAFLLDYEETASFRRAFVRWNGITPSEYRLHASRNLAA